jgi:hypothetical protein
LWLSTGLADVELARPSADVRERNQLGELRQTPSPELMLMEKPCIKTYRRIGRFRVVCDDVFARRGRNCPRRLGKVCRQSAKQVGELKTRRVRY